MSQQLGLRGALHRRSAHKPGDVASDASEHAFDVGGGGGEGGHELVRSLLSGLTVVRSPKAFFTVFLYSIPVWAMEAAMYYLIALGFDVRSQFDSQLEFIAVLLVFTAAANLAGVLPSSAGSWGPFDFFGAAALVAVGVPKEIAVGFALTVHVALWVPVTVLGAILLVMDGSSLRRLMRGVRRERQQAGGETPATARPEGP